MKKLLLAVVLLLAACKGEKIQNAPKAGDVINIPAVQWVVADKSTMMDVYRNSGMDIAEGASLKGFVGTRDDGTQVMYTLAPEYVDDDATLTVGHEVLHLAIGDYHR